MGGFRVCLPHAPGGGTSPSGGSISGESLEVALIGELLALRLAPGLVSCSRRERRAEALVLRVRWVGVGRWGGVVRAALNAQPAVT